MVMAHCVTSSQGIISFFNNFNPVLYFCHLNLHRDNH